tara:strand:- start:134 stop:529 length:396 start_codon:yes stop_codon:yes gene_type:complete
MSKKFLKKIIAQNPDDLRVISALCSDAQVNQSQIKFLKTNKVFILPMERKSEDDTEFKKKISSILKFDFIDQSKSKNINQENITNKLKLLAIDLFKKGNNYEIVLLFSNNGVITLSAEIVEVTLEDIRQND